MPQLPRRRWFQYKLGTWFVLVAILAWAMLYWPWVKLSPVVWGPIVQTGPDSFQQSYAQPIEFDPGLINPALALAVFVGWKAAWAVGRRVARGKAEPASSAQGSAVVARVEDHACYGSRAGRH